MVAGGEGTEAILNSAELYDPVEGTWTNTQNPLNTGRAYHTAIRLADGRVLVAGGRGNP